MINRRIWILLVLFLIGFPFYLQAQEETKNTSDSLRIEMLKTKRLVHHIYFGGNYYTTPNEYGKNTSSQTGGIFGMEMAFHDYISFTDTTEFLAKINEDKSVDFVFAYFLGFRFYLGNPFVFIEQRIGLLDHFSYWEGQHYVEYATASLIGFAIPLTPKREITLDTLLEWRYSFYNTYESDNSNFELPGPMSWGINILVNFLLY